jgi:enamine deaminase RidA (YjgF/YER057c/UK114 family)
VLQNIEAILSKAGSSKEMVCKEFFGDPPPARSTIVGPRFPPGTLVGADAIAVL